MRPSQVRAELLGEHFKLRSLIEEARTLLGGHDTSGALWVCIERLGDALFFHSRHEEHALRGVLETVHARTPGRYRVMDQSHVSEHAQLVTDLRRLRSSGEPTRRARLAVILRTLEAHMTEEEEVLLSEDDPAD
ncbi:MAG TPA: hemerythrin domain-containing protein [Polyangiaceae bacterium]